METNTNCMPMLSLQKATNQLLCMNEIPAEVIQSALVNYFLKKNLNSVILPHGELLLTRFERFICEYRRDQAFGPSREAIYRVLLNCLKRFLTIRNQLNMLVQEVDVSVLSDFFDFLRNEHTYVKKYPHLYAGMLPQNRPNKPRRQNTIATRAQMIQTFFTDLETRGEIDMSPFRRMNRERRRALKQVSYDAPVCLTASEFAAVMTTKLPAELEECRTAFILQCAFGIRISDFLVLKMKNIAITESGIPYIHYRPVKSSRQSKCEREIRTPIMLFALRIIKDTRFKLTLPHNLTGKSGYNVKIKELLKYCKINRLCPVFNEQANRMEYLPLWQLASSKLARKTHVDMLYKIQLDQYISGLHDRSSDAVLRYLDKDLEYLFKLMCAAFRQPLYTANKNLSEIKIETNH